MPVENIKSTASLVKDRVDNSKNEQARREHEEKEQARLKLEEELKKAKPPEAEIPTTEQSDLTSQIVDSEKVLKLRALKPQQKKNVLSAFRQKKSVPKKINGAY